MSDLNPTLNNQTLIMIYFSNSMLQIALVPIKMIDRLLHIDSHLMLQFLINSCSQQDQKCTQHSSPPTKNSISLFWMKFICFNEVLLIFLAN